MSKVEVLMTMMRYPTVVERACCDNDVISELKYVRPQDVLQAVPFNGGGVLSLSEHWLARWWQ
jgi:hypothetical protein